MKVTKFLFIASVLTTRTCRLDTVPATSSADESTSNFIKDVVEILTSCYADRLHTVGLAGNLAGPLSRTLSTEHLIPVVLIGVVRTDDSKYAQHPPAKFRHKIHVFVIEASTYNQLVDILLNIRMSIWWNSTASFIIINRKCTNFYYWLRVAWRLDLINAKVLCHSRDVSRAIISYNPFTSQAPDPWHRIGQGAGINDHPFNLFYRDYPPNTSICTNLDFEKSNNLGGYEIRVQGAEHMYEDFSISNRTRYRSMISAETVLSLVYRALNGTAKFSGNYLEPKWDITNIPALSGKTHDEDVSQEDFITYPHTIAGNIIVSQFRGYKSKRDEIFYALDADVWIGVGVVYLIAFIFFKFYLRQSVIPAILNILRVTCNTGLTNIPDNDSPRIYICCLFIFVTIVQGFFLCDLAAVLTTKFPLKNVNTLDDAETFGYKVCVDNKLNTLKPASFKGLIINADHEDCLRYTKNDSAVAWFVIYHDGLLRLAQESKLHLSEEIIEARCVGFFIREGWALEDPVNKIIQKLFEADVLYPWDVKYNRLELTAFEHDNEYQYTECYKPLELADLAFAFIFLGIGLACATVAFIFELVTPYVTRHKWICS